MFPLLLEELIIIFLFVSSKIYDKRDDFDFDIVNLPFLDDDVLRSVYLSAYKIRSSM